MILGIDPGLTGGLALLDPLARGHAHLADMPTVGETPNTLVDAASICEWLTGADVDMAVIENVHSQPTDSAGRAFKMGRGIGALYAMLQILRIPVTKVTPGVWKKHFKLTGTGKEESRLRALELYPELHDQLKLKKHHNRAEALLMARWHLEQ